MVIRDFHFSPPFFSMKYFGWIGEIKNIFYGFASLTPIEIPIIRWSSATFIFYLYFSQWNILDELERLKISSMGERSEPKRNTHKKMVIRDFHFSPPFFTMKYFGWMGETEPIEIPKIRWSSATFIFHLRFLQ